MTFPIVLLSLLPFFAAAEISLTTQLFQLSGGNTLDNVKLTWALVSNAKTYDIMRRSSSGSYDLVASAPGNTFDIYNLAGAETYQVRAMDGTSQLDASSDAVVTPRTPGSGTYASYDNTAVSTLRLKSTLVGSDGTFYQYNYVADSQGFNHISMQTSTNGYDFTGDTAVLQRQDVCTGIQPDNLCRLESISFAQHPTTKQIVMWAHLENNEDYTLGQVAVAYGDPGQTMTFGGTSRPEGDDSRDLSFFADNDGKGYIISAINTNTDLGLYSLTDDWTNVSSKLGTLQAGERREAPAMVHEGDYYYLMSSIAAGWYPSPGKFISAQSLSGPWSASANIGNIATFGAQSGQINKIGTNYVMAANRWAANWAIKEASNRQILLPISFSNGFASYDFYSTIQYDAENGDVFGVQSGQILSIGQPSSSSGASDAASNASLANDGTQDDPNSLFIPAAVPFWWEVDLGAAHTISQVDVTAKQTGGSETYLQYNVTGSTDQQAWTLLADELNNGVVGFVSSEVTDSGSYRYMRVNVEKVINIQNGNEADFAAGLHEVMVYGT